MVFLESHAVVPALYFTRKCSLCALTVIKLQWFRKEAADQMGITGQELQLLTGCGSSSAMGFRQTTTLQKQHHQILMKSHITECSYPAQSAWQMSVQSDQSAVEALLVPAKPTKTSRGKIFCTSGIIPLKLPRKSMWELWVLQGKDSLEGSSQRVKHKWRATQHFLWQVQEWNPHWFSVLSQGLTGHNKLLVT